MGHEKGVAGARNILSKSFLHSKPKNIRILGTFCYVLYKQPTTNIFSLMYTDAEHSITVRLHTTIMMTVQFSFSQKNRKL